MTARVTAARQVARGQFLDLQNAGIVQSRGSGDLEIRTEAGELSD